jgi:transcriptional regulator with XRE-family HTH domain
MHQPATFEVNGAAIRTKRMQAGIEAQVLADAIGITASYLRKLETGARKHMRPGLYVPLRAALNASDNELLLAPHRGPTPEAGDSHAQRPVREVPEADSPRRP